MADGDLSGYCIPKTTSIIIIGPKGAGKSSLINRIARVIEDDEFSPDRAQESYGMSSQGGTFFVQEYTIPRGASASFCLYDTRGLSQISSSDNISMIDKWITKGVHHGQPVIWTSDSSDLRDRLIQDGCTGCEIRKVNYVIFVVNAVEILKSMESEPSISHMISTAFNCPSLSFKDDKPTVAMTHGDLLTPEERARVRVFLGELLGIPPHKQIFDIPESQDAATALTICNLLRHSLEHADKNIRFKVQVGVSNKTSLLDFMMFTALSLFIALMVLCIFHMPLTCQNVAHDAQHKFPISPSPGLHNLTDEAQLKIRIAPQWIIGDSNNAHVPNPEYEGEPSIDWHTARGSRFDEGKVAEADAEADAETETEAEASFDLQTTRRLWYVE